MDFVVLDRSEFVVAVFALLLNCPYRFLLDLHLHDGVCALLVRISLICE